MILLEQTVNQILMEEGQTIISLSDLGLTWDNIEDLFIGTYNQAKSYISVYDWTDSTITQQGEIQEDWAQVKHISYIAAQRFQRYMPDVPGNYWEFNPYTKRISAMMNSNFSLEVSKYPKCEKSTIEINHNDVKSGKKINFELPFSVDKNLLRINDGTNDLELELSEVKYTERYSKYICGNQENNKIIQIAGDIYGSINQATWKVSLTPQHDYDTLKFICTSKYVNIMELDLTCELFYVWFKDNLLTLIGSMKKQIDLNGVGLPFDISSDDLLTRGRELSAKVEELKGTKQHWSNF